MARPPPRFLLTILLLLEFALLTTLLGLFGYAHPNTYRTALRTIGVHLRLNSPPQSTASLSSSSSSSSYAASLSGISSTTLPAADPLVFREAAITFCLWLTIVSFLLLVSQAVLAILSSFHPLTAIIVNIILETLWMVSALVMQAGVGVGGERPWWVARSCSLAKNGGGNEASQGWCRQAQAALGASSGMCVLYACVLAWGVWVWIARREMKAREGLDKGKQNSLGYEEKDLDMELDPYCMTPRAGRFG